jgi:hypothetical protein
MLQVWFNEEEETNLTKGEPQRHRVMRARKTTTKVTLRRTADDLEIGENL